MRGPRVSSCLLAEVADGSVPSCAKQRWPQTPGQKRLPPESVAGIIIFDPKKVTDSATHVKGTLPTAGIP